MGQGQSSNTSDPASGGQEVKASYYVLLGIERTATEDEIKKAYRRKALELHPDRNYGNEEAATKTFAEIQAAYEILSDPQERAWYDSHESAILRGDDAGDAPTYEDVRVTTADDLTRLVRKFNSNVEFSDAPSGFFGFVRETFEQLAKEEEIAASWDDVDVPEYPSFGHKADNYNDVVKSFYAAWGGFSTVKTYSWYDKYRLSEAPDRWMRRRMEQENLRLRKDGRQEFNEAVRALVAFIKKRDPRYVPDTRTEEERQKALRDAAASQAARQRAANAAKIAEDSVPDWAKFREPEELEESEDEDIVEEILECVACNKTFKSERQWEAHEKSKKHIKAVKTLQHKMRKQNAHLNLDEDDISSGIATPEEVEEEEIEDDAAVRDDIESGERNERVPEENIDSDGEPEGTEEAEHPTYKLQDQEANGEDGDSAKKEANGEEESEGSADSEDADYASRQTIQARMQSASLEDTPATTGTEDDNKPAKPKMGKAAQKRAKKAAAAAVGQQAEADHKCQVCNAGFPSKTKLFQHIEDEGHAALKSASSTGAKGKRGKGKR